MYTLFEVRGCRGKGSFPEVPFMTRTPAGVHRVCARIRSSIGTDSTRAFQKLEPATPPGDSLAPVVIPITIYAA